MARSTRRTRYSSTAPQRICVRFPDWPAADQAAWHAACKAGAILSPGGAGASWRPKSRDALIANYGRWLGFLSLQGWLDAAEAPACRFTHVRVRAFITYFQRDRAPLTVAGSIAKLIMALNAMFPKVKWDWLRAARANLQAMAVPLRSKADRVESSWKLVDLGFDLMADAEALVPENADKAAGLYRDGLIIALLAMRPLRRHNFLGIEMGRHMLRSGDSWRLVFPAEETKGAREIEKTFPASLLVPMTRYLDCHRPRLLSPKLQHPSKEQAQAPVRLWISRFGNPLSLSGFCTHIGHHTEKRFGWRMDPHSFRHCLATTLSQDNPEAAWMGMYLLDHADFATTERYYIAALAAAAQGHYQALLDALRGTCAKGNRRGVWHGNLAPSASPMGGAQRRSLPETSQ